MYVHIATSKLDIRQVSRQINGMTKKHTPRRPAQDESQISLSVMEKAIGGKLVDRKSPAKPSSPSATKPPDSTNKT